MVMEYAKEVGRWGGLYVFIGKGSFTLSMISDSS